MTDTTLEILTGLTYGFGALVMFARKLPEEGVGGALVLAVGWLPYLLVYAGLRGVDWILGD